MVLGGVRVLHAPPARRVRAADHQVARRCFERFTSAICALRKMRPQGRGIAAPKLGGKSYRLGAVSDFMVEATVVGEVPGSDPLALGKPHAEVFLEPLIEVRHVGRSVEDRDFLFTRRQLLLENLDARLIAVLHEQSVNRPAELTSPPASSNCWAIILLNFFGFRRSVRLMSGACGSGLSASRFFFRKKSAMTPSTMVISSSPCSFIAFFIPSGDKSAWMKLAFW